MNTIQVKIKSRSVSQKLMALRLLGFNITDLINMLIQNYEIKVLK
mgnify:FL=1